MREGVDGLLRHKTRPADKAAFAADLVIRIVELTPAEPPGERAHGPAASMAKAAGAASAFGGCRCDRDIPNRILRRRRRTKKLRRSGQSRNPRACARKTDRTMVAR